MRKAMLTGSINSSVKGDINAFKTGEGLLFDSNMVDSII
jgi:hypothetical protein